MAATKLAPVKQISEVLVVDLQARYANHVELVFFRLHCENEARKFEF